MDINQYNRIERMVRKVDDALDDLAVTLDASEEGLNLDNYLNVQETRAKLYDALAAADDLVD